MSEKFLSLGVPLEFIPHAKHFASVFRHLGMTPAQIDAAIAWGASFDGKTADRLQAFEIFCEQHGIDQTNADLALSWHGQVNERGIAAMPAIPAEFWPADAEKRRHEIEMEMKKPRGESEYWRNPEMRDEYRALLEAGAAGEYIPSPTGDDSARRSEIERTMREDRDRYWRDEAMQHEYSNILQRAVGETSVSTPNETSHNDHVGQGNDRES
jgi:hypothetical protein